MYIKIKNKKPTSGGLLTIKFSLSGIEVLDHDSTCNCPIIIQYNLFLYIFSLLIVFLKYYLCFAILYKSGYQYRSCELANVLNESKQKTKILNESLNGVKISSRLGIVADHQTVSLGSNEMGIHVCCWGRGIFRPPLIKRSQLIHVRTF